MKKFLIFLILLVPVSIYVAEKGDVKEKSKARSLEAIAPVEGETTGRLKPSLQPDESRGSHLPTGLKPVPVDQLKRISPYLHLKRKLLLYNSYDHLPM